MPPTFRVHEHLRRYLLDEVYTRLDSQALIQLAIPLRLRLLDSRDTQGGQRAERQIEQQLLENLYAISQQVAGVH